MISPRIPASGVDMLAERTRGSTRNMQQTEWPTEQREETDTSRHARNFAALVLAWHLTPQRIEGRMEILAKGLNCG